MSEIRVHVITKQNRKNLYLLAKNGETGERFERSARTSRRKEADKAAIAWQLELERGIRPDLITWAVFVERFDTEHLSEVRASTMSDVKVSLELFASLAGPKKLRDVNESRVATYRKALKAKYDSTATINKHLRNLRTAINWAAAQRLIANPPRVKELKTDKGSEAKGRPITAEEFERMEVAAEKFVGSEKASEWLFLLRGLWWSGLRIGEAISLSWDEWHDGLTVDMSGKHVLLRVPAEHEKGGRHRLLPIAPQFAEMLRSVPENQREGFVFSPKPKRVCKFERATLGVASKTIAKVGKRAGVVVARKPKLKHASAHDCRRAFGFRWAKLVMPAILKELMRHESIDTTMKYYVGANAEETADVLQQVVGATPPVDTLVDTRRLVSSTAQDETSQTM